MKDMHASFAHKKLLKELEDEPKESFILHTYIDERCIRSLVKREVKTGRDVRQCRFTDEILTGIHPSCSERKNLH